MSRKKYVYETKNISYFNIDSKPTQKIILCQLGNDVTEEKIYVFGPIGYEETMKRMGPRMIYLQPDASADRGLRCQVDELSSATTTNRWVSKKPVHV